MEDKTIKILLIEDDESMVKVIGAWLKMMRQVPCELVWADSLGKGLDFLNKTAIDAVLLDLNLPDSKSMETIPRTCSAAPSVPVIVLTGADGGEIGISAVKMGAQDYLTKGEVNPQLMMRSIMFGIERKRMEIDLKQSKESWQKHYETISKATQKLVSPEVLSQLMESPEERTLKAEQKIITVLFADVRSFTTISEGNPADMVIKLLNHLLGEMVVSVLEEGGYLDKFLGDGLMAIFGAPTSTENDWLRAVRAAYKMQARIDIFNRQREVLFPGLTDLDSDIKIGVGIHSGRATVGFVGTAERCEYTAIGDCVNIASRLAAEAEGGEILITRVVSDALGNEGQVGDWRIIQLRGKKLSTEVAHVKYVNL